MKTADGLNIALGDTVRVLRLEQNLTQEQLAEKCDISTVYISEIERGIKSPTLKMVLTISTALDLKLSQFIVKLEERISYK